MNVSQITKYWRTAKHWTLPRVINTSSLQTSAIDCSVAIPYYFLFNIFSTLQHAGKPLHKITIGVCYVGRSHHSNNLLKSTKKGNNETVINWRYWVRFVLQLHITFNNCTIESFPSSIPWQHFSQALATPSFRSHSIANTIRYTRKYHREKFSERIWCLEFCTRVQAQQLHVLSFEPLKFKKSVKVVAVHNTKA